MVKSKVSHITTHHTRLSRSLGLRTSQGTTDEVINSPCGTAIAPAAAAKLTVARKDRIFRVVVKLSSRKNVCMMFENSQSAARLFYKREKDLERD